MVRQIIKAKSETINIVIPEDYVGKTIEILAFPIEENENITKKRKAEIIEKFRKMQTDMTGYKFDRDEANER